MCGAKDKLLLVSIKLRYELLNEDLTDRFCISPNHCSNILETWIRLLSKSVGKLVVWLPKESVAETMPKIFKTAGHGKLRCTIDCSEVFIEWPKKFNDQAAACLDYKSHNTIKFPIHMVAEQVINSFAVLKSLLNSSIGMINLW